MSNGPNLFARLHKWAAIKGQEENFFTESLALVLEQLLILAPEAGVRLVSRLTVGFINFEPSDASKIEIRAQPQVVGEKKKADLEFHTSDDRLVWIEVKVKSPLAKGQLKNYLDLLEKSGVEHTRLILLTLSPIELQGEEARQVLKLRWFDFADWLENELLAVNDASVIAGFVARQFLDFLRGRNMAMTQVGRQMPDGVRALSNFLNMLFMAATNCSLTVTNNKPDSAWDYIGFNLRFNSRKYWIGLHYAEPNKLHFYTDSHVDPDAADLRGIELEKTGSGYGWRRCADLASESVHFFDRSKGSQMEWLSTFLHESLAIAQSIQTPDQPRVTPKSEES